MWPSLLRSPSHIHPPAASAAAPSHSNFSCSSFKDVLALVNDDDDEPKQVLSRTRKHSLFRRIRLSASILRYWSAAADRLPPSQPIRLSGADDRVVLYTTTLRVVRRTYDDCAAVRSILRGFRVSVDERDLSMDARFLAELHRIFGPSENLTLPRVFIAGRYVGGADEIGRLHESGELKKVIQGLQLDEVGVCGACGGHRYVLCQQCNGSHKVFVDEKSGFKSCLDCNENGLIRCSSCAFDLF